MSRRVVVPVVMVLAVAVGVGLYLFQPWRAFTNTTVDEALPVAAPKSATMPDKAAKDLSSGDLVTHDHTTSGSVRLVRLANGGQVLRLEGLKTSEGPDVRVFLSTRSADEVKSKGVGKEALDLGFLKGNLGNQNYTLPADTDVSKFRSAVIWCKRFSSSFGAADLTPVKS